MNKHGKVIKEREKGHRGRIRGEMGRGKRWDAGINSNDNINNNNNNNNR